MWSCTKYSENLSNPDTLGTISGVLISGVSLHANATFGTAISVPNMEVS